MIGDRNRMDTYYKAITKNVNEGDVVIDLGTGTGILSFFASKKSPKKIYAIEHGEIIETAKKIAAHNNITCIEFANCNSKDFTINDKADIIIHEQIGALLFDEKMIENISDLRDRLLNKDGKILPGKYEVFLVPVKLKDNAKVPFIWEQEIHGINYNCFDELKNKRLDSQYGILKVRPENIDYFMSEPEKILYYDMEKMNKDDIKNEFTFKSKINRSGKSDGLCFFFNIIFDDEILLSTNPLTSWTHWNIPILRIEEKNFEIGDEVIYNFEWSDVSDINTYNWKIKSV